MRRDPGERAGVLMLGPDDRGAGGIASVVRVYRDAGLFAEPREVRYVPTHAPGGGAATLRAWLAAAVALVSDGARGHVRVVHAHSASRGSFLRKSLLLLLARSLGARTVLHLHGAEFRIFAERECGPLARRWIARSLADASAVVTLSAAWRDYVRGLVPGAAVHVLPNPVAVRPGPARCPEPGRVLFLGRIGPRKGVHELVDAIARPVPGAVPLRLVVAGDGDPAPVIAHAHRVGVADRVELLGWIDPAERARQLARAEVFALPSHNEGLPMAMLEAMAAGVPVVASAVGGIPDAVVHRVHGLLVAPGDVDALHDAIAELVRDPALREQLASAAAERIRAECEADVVVDALRALWRSVDPPEPRAGIQRKVAT